MRRIFPILVFVAMSFAAIAEETTNPIRYTWIATSCETWNCAAAALVLADGDKHLIVLPTGRDETPWVILRRVEEGSIYIPEDEPFACTVFEATAEATTHFQGLESCRNGIMLSAPDGRMVVTALQSCGSGKRRAVH